MPAFTLSKLTPCLHSASVWAVMSFMSSLSLNDVSSANANSSLSVAVSQSPVPFRTRKFLFLAAVLFCCHLINALISEHLLAGARIFKFSIFFTCFQCSGYILLAIMSRAFLMSEPRRTPLRTYALIGTLQAITLTSSVRISP
jgi:hypothetical protein